MNNSPIYNYASSHWQGYLKPISELSKSEDGRVLINSNLQYYSFDVITEDVSDKTKMASTDAIWFSEKAIELVEYKTGFRDIIDINNYDPSKARCPKHNEACEDVYKWVCKNRRQEKDNLLLNIRLKALESIITLKKRIFPQCNQVQSIPINLTVVIDANPTDEEEKILGELSNDSGFTSNDSNPLDVIKQSLSRYNSVSDEDGKTFLFNSIEVLGSQSYLSRITIA